MTATSLLVRLYHAMVEARMRAAMREIAHHPHIQTQVLAAQARLDAIPHDEVRETAGTARYADAGLLPFVRGA